MSFRETVLCLFLGSMDAYMSELLNLERNEVLLLTYITTVGENEQVEAICRKRAS